MEPPDPIVLREALRQGERILAWQDLLREALLQRSEALLRLAVATVGGVILVVGLLVTSPLLLADWAVSGLLAGVLPLIIAAGLLARLLAGGRTLGPFTYGPRMSSVVGGIRRSHVDEASLLLALLDRQPDAIGENDALIERIQGKMAVALVMLSLGTFLLVLTLIFILGGTILA